MTFGSKPLKAPLRRLWTLLWMTLGILPTGLFFIWLERGGVLPGFGPAFGFPWVDGIDWPFPFQIVWNLTWVGLFGATHTLLAQPEVREGLRRRGKPRWLWQAVLQPSTERAFYVIVTGITLLLIPSLWQGTGQIAWQVSLLPPSLTIGGSLVLFWGLLGFAAFLMSRHGTARFLGLSPLLGDDSPDLAPSVLLTRGLYRFVRHPIYTVTLAAFFLTPLMTWDRLLVSLGMTIYLSLGIPIEERKLVRQFGNAYLQYQKEVPPLVPGVRPLLRSLLKPFKK